VRCPFVKITVDPQQMVPLRLLGYGIVIVHYEIFVQRVYLQLHILMFLDNQLHLQDRLQVKNIENFQVLSCLNQYQKLLAFSFEHQWIFEQFKRAYSFEGSLCYVLALCCQSDRRRILHQNDFLFEYRRNQ
jgi:hypothetical protein